jgi:hypothetical protein
MNSFPLPDGEHNDAWKSLLCYAFPVIDEVTRTRGVPFPIQIGGGSMLLRHYRHRRSRDLDLFVTDMRLVRWCSPRFNEAAADIFPDYEEERAATKLVIDMQEIDIIAAAPIIEDGHVEPAMLLGRSVLIEKPREILAKKLVYRGRQFQPRDIFDVAAVAAIDPWEVAAILPWLELRNLENVKARLNEVEPLFENEMATKVDAYP